jgi:hypothetical protein
MLLLWWSPFAVFCQKRVISGKIANSAGEAVPLATVQQKGTSNFVTADGNGHFSIHVSGASPVLVISSTGYQKQEVPVTDATSYDVQLKEGGTLNEVVVSTAFGIRQSPIKETTLSQTIGGTKTLVTTIPYAPAHSKNKDLDTLLVPYTLPAAASGTVIRLDYQITNVDTLNIVRTVYVKVQ